jgi:hypothetical protein
MRAQVGILSSLLLIKLRLLPTGKRLFTSDLGRNRVATVHHTTDKVFDITYELGRKLDLLRQVYCWVTPLRGTTPFT